MITQPKERSLLVMISLFLRYVMITARVQSTTGGYVFTGVCVCSTFGGGVTPSQVQVEGTHPADRGVPHPRSRWGGYPSSKTGWGTPPSSGDRAAQRALATRRAVCLLHSCRRTSLFNIFFRLHQVTGEEP